MASKTILIVHAEVKPVLQSLQRLQDLHYRIEYAQGGVNGINAAYALKPDLIVADIFLPEVNGYQLCRLLKNDEAMRVIPVLLVSDEEEKLDRFWSFKAGADAFIWRAEIESKLVGQIEMLLEIYGRLTPSIDPTQPRAGAIDSEWIQSRLNQVLDKALIESTLMIEFRNLNELIHDKSLLNYMLSSLLESILEYDVLAVFFNDRTLDPRSVTFSVTDCAPLSTTALESMKDRFFWAVQDKIPSITEPVSHQFELIGAIDEQGVEPEFKTVYLREFYTDNRLIGAIGLYSRKEIDYARHFPVRVIESEIKALMNLRNVYSHAQILAITDGLTGLFNYPHFMTTLEREFKRAKRYEMPLSLAIIDIDGLRKLNDEWGQPAGDSVLKQLSAMLRECFRGIDFLARYGGEELVIIFPETALDNATNACSRFRQNVAENRIQWEEAPISVTVSIGVAEALPNMRNASDLLRLADQTLQTAKKSGRNRVEVSARSH